MSYEMLSGFFVCLFSLIHKQASSASLQANFKGEPAGREDQGK